LLSGIDSALENAGHRKNFYKIFKINKFIFYLCNNSETTPFEIEQWVLSLSSHTLCNRPFSWPGDRIKWFMHLPTENVHL
jgi:hypothetical protein